MAIILQFPKATVKEEVVEVSSEEGESDTEDLGETPVGAEGTSSQEPSTSTGAVTGKGKGKGKSSKKDDSSDALTKVNMAKVRYITLQ